MCRHLFLLTKERSSSLNYMLVRSFSCRYPRKKKQSPFVFFSMAFRGTAPLLPALIQAPLNSRKRLLSNSTATYSHSEPGQQQRKLTEVTGMGSSRGWGPGEDGHPAHGCAGLRTRGLHSIAQVSTHTAGSESVPSSFFLRTILSSHPLRLTARIRLQ